MDVSHLDLRVGKIVKVQKHPTADNLYVEEVDLGEGKPRQILSALVKHVTLQEMQVIFLEISGIEAIFRADW
jgi:tRNA-binding EMAP/Myf-like protein